MPGEGQGPQALAQTTAIAPAMARICNAADRPKQGCARREGLDQRCPKACGRSRQAGMSPRETLGAHQATSVLRTPVFVLGAARRAHQATSVLRTPVFALGAARRAHARATRLSRRKVPKSPFGRSSSIRKRIEKITASLRPADK